MEQQVCFSPKSMFWRCSFQNKRLTLWGCCIVRICLNLLFNDEGHYLWWNVLSLVVFRVIKCSCTDIVVEVKCAKTAIASDTCVCRIFSTAHALVSSAIAFYLLYISDLFRESAPYGPVVFRSSILSQFGLGVRVLFCCSAFLYFLRLRIVLMSAE